jgi:hypothetical protein
MDDVNAKIRRNLIVISSLTICLLIFSVSEKVLLRKLLGDDSFQISKLSVYFLYLVVQIYFLFRYRFSEGYENLSSTYTKDLDRLSDKFIHKHVLKELNKSLRSGVISTIFITNQNSFEKYIKEFMGKYKNGFFKLCTLEDTYISYDNGIWNSYIKFSSSFYLEPSVSRAHTVKEESLKYKIVGVQKFFLYLKIRLELFFYSKTSIEYLTPIALAAFAILLLFFYIANELL